MKAVQFNFTIPRYALGLAVAKLAPSLLWSGLSCTSMQEVAEPSFPTAEWVRIRTRLGGICGTDLGTIYLHTSPYFSPYSDFPFTFGHENVGTVSEVGSQVKGIQPGERVIVEPTLWCAPRGYAKDEWCEFCAKGEINRCQRRSGGKLAPGMFIGSSKDTGGSWSEAFIAHQSQVYRVPDNVSDENALMVEPFSCGLHTVLIDMPSDDETILILGAGTMGLVTLAALRALGNQARILVSARYPHQAEAARKLGASEVLSGRDLYTQIAERTGATLLKPTIGKLVMEGGVDRVYECTGNDNSLDDANRFTKRGGTVVLVGLPGQAKGIDWSAIFTQELRVLAATEYSHADTYKGKTWKTYDLALDLMEKGKVDLGWMVSRRYALGDYKQALADLAQKGSQGIIKAVFEFPSAS
ncbi:MAG: alcohol dehydrogenase catalytic domain-containing protein [Anaerolineales bacterium]|nr:alcohol dehydrogenase catalytic domain-containing protein [Anaerolineales bacterium]